MKSLRSLLFCLLGVGVMLFMGCEAFIPVTPPPPKMKPPFAYEALAVRNSCFVESVHFYDIYLEKKADNGWVRILQWGNQDGDYKISSGHAVAVYVADGNLCGYDINFGFWPIDLPVEKRAYLNEVSPKVFAHYPQFRPVFARYREDFMQEARTKRPDFLFYHANHDVRDATRVASELGRFRPVSVVEFNYMENGVKQTSAVAAFVFNGRLCVYFPPNGTHISDVMISGVDDLNQVALVIRRLYPSATGIRPQAGGYLLFPPKN
jgi:hypothetical protein